MYRKILTDGKINWFKYTACSMFVSTFTARKIIQILTIISDIFGAEFSGCF